MIKLRGKPLQFRLEYYREINSDTGCWLWTGAKIRGHGVIRVDGKNIYVHRASMHIYKGFDLGSSDLICHVRTCPNKHCFCPEHLYVGDDLTNSADAVALGTKSRYWGRWNRKKD